MYLTAILMGLAGGLHCVGMCGPLVLAATAKNPFAGSKLIYNLGRVLTYGLLGILAGSVGGLIQITPIQNVFAYVLGGLFLLMGFGAISGVHIPLLSSVIHRFTNWLKATFGNFLQGKKNIFFLGMLNGLLPCGLTYLALTYCFTLDSFVEGFLFMVIFGLGTIPVMVGLLWLLGNVLNKLKISYRKVSMIVMIAIGSLVIGRALISHENHFEKNAGGNVLIDDVICR
ncbi:MAG: sulfite exporter TauE/SafE family protein [Cyclobacteriaceae bacterium]